jgi:hypothetical protein
VSQNDLNVNAVPLQEISPDQYPIEDIIFLRDRKDKEQIEKREEEVFANN